METNITNKKQTKGRQKIEMKMIQKEDDRLITFSKRRSGVYKKTSELVTLCGAEVGLVIFSPSGKPFSYGHPSIDVVANKHLLLDHMTPHPLPPVIDPTTHPIMEAHRKLRINELNQKYNDMNSHLEAEKERRKELQKVAVAASEGWWEKPTEGFSLDELKQRLRSLEELHANISNHIKERMAMSLESFNNNNNNNNALVSGVAPSSFYAASSSGQISTGVLPPSHVPYRPQPSYGYGLGHGFNGIINSS